VEDAEHETPKLAAILVSRVVGYSRCAGADEDLILARLRTLRSDSIDPIISVHHGRIGRPRNRRVPQRGRRLAMSNRSPDSHGRAKCEALFGRRPDVAAEGIVACRLRLRVGARSA
jgi:hypothetical protein